MPLIEETLSNQTGTSLEFEIGFQAPAGWNDFARRHTGCIFHEEAWARVLSKGYQNQVIYACFKNGDEIVLGISGIIFDFRVFKLFFSTIPYGGFIGDSRCLAGFLEKLEAGFKKFGINQIRITRISHYPYPDLPGYQIKKAWQHVVSVKGKTLEEIWRGHKKDTRRDVSKARKSGVFVREIQGREDLEDYFALYQMTMKRNESLCHYTRGLYDAIFEDLIAANKGTILFAEYEGRKIAGVLLIFGEDRAYLLGNASHPEFMKYCPNDLLYQAAIEKSLEKGFSCFDLMMSEEKDNRLIRFKEKWRSEKFDFFIFQKDLSPWRCRLWRGAWKIAASRPGAFLVSLLRRGR